MIVSVELGRKVDKAFALSDTSRAAQATVDHVCFGDQATRTFVLLNLRTVHAQATLFFLNNKYS